MGKFIKVKVFPGCKKQAIVRKADDELEIFVKARPVRGMATAEATAVLASYFNVASPAVRLIKGARERNKIFEIIESALL